MAVDPTTSIEERRALSERIARSALFAKSPRLREMLRHLVETALSGRSEELKEQAIGCAVFKRTAGYDPITDNVVRVQARQLRLKLEEYFGAEGKGEPVVLEIPKGGYVPLFRPRGERTPRRAWPWRATSGVLAVVLAAVTVAWRQSAEPALFWPWTQLVHPQRSILIIGSDPIMTWARRISRRPVTLEDYVKPGYPLSLLEAGVSPETESSMRLAGAQRATSLADLVLTAEIVRRFGSRADRLVVRLAREVRYRDLQENNLIIIGTASGSNPWASLFEKQLNFQSSADDFPYFANRKPAAGESSRYVTVTRTPNPGLAYGVVALLKHPDHDGSVMLIQGATMEASEGVGRFLLDEHGARELAAKTARRRFEALLRTQALGGASTDTAVMAVRLHP